MIWVISSITMLGFTLEVFYRMGLNNATHDCKYTESKSWVRKEYLQDGQSGHGEFVEDIKQQRVWFPGILF